MKPLVIDIETVDPDLARLGPAVYRGTGRILGVGVYDPDRDQSVFARWPEDKQDLAEELATERPKLLANAAYDLDWLENWGGVPVNGFIHDVQNAEPLLDAYALHYDLDTLAAKYGVAGKKLDVLRPYYERIMSAGRFGHRKNVDMREILGEIPINVVGEYCLQDLKATYDVWVRQMKLLEEQKLYALYEVECKLVRLRLMMRRNGIRIDREAQREADHTLIAKEGVLYKELRILAGKDFNMNSSRQLAEILTGMGYELPTTAKGALSVTKEVLGGFADEPFPKGLLRLRALNKLRTGFIEKAVSDHICPDGRLHGEFFNLRKDDGGTVTGRWSAAHPNLQQIPRNDKELGGLARGMFIPDEGCWYGHTDYSQIEYRVFAHYARGMLPGDRADLAARAMRERYRADPNTDYHTMAQETVQKLTGTLYERPQVKRFNFGVLYGMGIRTMSKNLGIPQREAQELYNKMMNGLPFIRTTSEVVQARAKMKGFVRTVGGRLQRVSDDVKENNKYFKFLNYLIQGSAADIMKFALVKCYEDGVYDTLRLHLLVHDETGVSIPKTREGIEAYREQKRIMETALPIGVPIVAEADYGDSWATYHEVGEGLTVFEQMEKEL